MATIVCALDTEDEAQAQVVMVVAREEAKLRGAKLHLLNVVSIPILATAGGASAPSADEVADLTSDAQQFVDAICDEPAEEAHVRMAEDSVGETIAHYADQVGAVRIVMGRSGRSGIATLFLGSVTQETLKNTKVPVVVVAG